MYIKFIEMKFRLTLYYSKDGANVMEVAYQFLGLDPAKYKLHASVKVS